MAADILKEYSSSLEPQLIYDRMQQEQFAKLLESFYRVINETTVEIVEKNVQEHKPVKETQKVEQKNEQISTEETKSEEPKARKNFPLVVKLNPFKEGEKSDMKSEEVKKVRF